MKEIPDESIDSIVTDPPYELGFMGKEWDKSGIAYQVEVWEECLRVLKPGGHLLAFGGSRTYHRLACAIEDAGFEIRDQIMWIYGSGFPKSLDISKALDKAAGAEREVVGEKGLHKFNTTRADKNKGKYGKDFRTFEEANALTAPSTDAARKWAGFGTALKPAHEPLVLARKPLIGTVAQNVLKHGTGGINVDGCRVEHANEKDFATSSAKNPGREDKVTSGIYGASRPQQSVSPSGRWPSNLIHDGSEEVVGKFPETGPPEGGSRKINRSPFSTGSGEKELKQGFADSGSAARFFYCAKSSKEDRNWALDSTRTVKYNVPIGGALCKDVSTALVQSLRKATSGLETLKWNTDESGVSIMGQCPSDTLSITLMEIKKITTSKILNLLMSSPISASIQDANLEMANGGSLAGNAGKYIRSCPGIISEKMGSALGVKDVVSQMLSIISDGGNWKPKSNIHATVKPLDLMKYLCRLITPPGGIVLDPFAGSGSTCRAAFTEGFKFIGIEIDEEYTRIANARLNLLTAGLPL